MVMYVCMYVRTWSCRAWWEGRLALGAPSAALRRGWNLRWVRQPRRPGRTARESSMPALGLGLGLGLGLDVAQVELLEDLPCLR